MNDQRYRKTGPSLWNAVLQSIILQFWQATSPCRYDLIINDKLTTWCNHNCHNVPINQNPRCGNRNFHREPHWLEKIGFLMDDNPTTPINLNIAQNYRISYNFPQSLLHLTLLLQPCWYWTLTIVKCCDTQ